MIAYELTTKEKGKSYTLEIKTPAGLKESFKGNLFLKTTSPKKPEITLAVMGIVQKEIKVNPQYLYFGIIDSSKNTIDPERLKRKVTVSRARGNPVTIEKIEVSADWIKTEIATEQDTSGADYSVYVTLVKDKLPTGELREEVTIHTNYNTTSAITPVIVEAKVK
jgi:hypothetical protein